MRVLIRADAGSVPEIGTGHIIRSLALARALRTAPDFSCPEVVFATRGGPGFELGGQLLREAGFPCIDGNGLEPNSSLELNNIVQARPDMVILDRLATSSQLVTGLKDQGIIVVTFDDLGSGQQYADVTMNALLQDVPLRKNVFIGYKYLILPARTEVSSNVRERVSRVFVSFGGYDKRQLIDCVFKVMPAIPIPVRCDIALGHVTDERFRRYSEAAHDIEGSTGHEVRIHERPSDWGSLLQNSDLAIVAGGMTAFECARYGIPAIGLPQYEHQLQNLRRLEEAGCLKMAGEGMHVDLQEVSSILTKLSTDLFCRRKMSDAGRRLIDGRGLDRVLGIFQETLSWG